jgi:hypothetical protein
MCDEEKPQCGRCRKWARECVPDDLLTFRSGKRVAARAQLRGPTVVADLYSFVTPELDNVFADDHRWLETPSTCESISAVSRSGFSSLTSVASLLSV